MLGRKAKITESIYKTDFSVLIKQELSPKIKLSQPGTIKSLCSRKWATFDN